MDGMIHMTERILRSVQAGIRVPAQLALLYAYLQAYMLYHTAYYVPEAARGEYFLWMLIGGISMEILACAIYRAACRTYRITCSSDIPTCNFLRQQRMMIGVDVGGWIIIMISLYVHVICG